MKQEQLAAYADMLTLPHPEPRTRPRMPLANRAAQFAPFDALTGYGTLILETARETETEAELDESRKEQLDLLLTQLLAAGEAGPEVRITWFVPDAWKSGGAYRTDRGRIAGWYPREKKLLLEDGTAIPVSRIRSMDAGDGWPLELPMEFL